MTDLISDDLVCGNCEYLRNSLNNEIQFKIELRESLFRKIEYYDKLKNEYNELSDKYVNQENKFKAEYAKLGKTIKFMHDIAEYHSNRVQDIKNRLSHITKVIDLRDNFPETPN